MVQVVLVRFPCSVLRGPQSIACTTGSCRWENGPRFVEVVLLVVVDGIVCVREHRRWETKRMLLRAGFLTSGYC
jgi:hypothetical protein